MISFLDLRCKLEDSENLSGHDAILATIDDVAIEKDKVETDNSYECFAPNKIRWEENDAYQEMTAQSLQYLINSYELPEHLPTLVELMSNAFIMCANKCFPTIPKAKIAKHNRPYFSKPLREAYDQHKKTCKRWRLAGRPSSHNHPA